MLTCIACSKQLNNGSLHQQEEDEAVQTPSTKQAIKALTAQVNCQIPRISRSLSWITSFQKKKKC